MQVTGWPLQRGLARVRLGGALRVEQDDARLQRLPGGKVNRNPRSPLMDRHRSGQRIELHLAHCPQRSFIQRVMA
jgi:hypothetical protein